MLHTLERGSQTVDPGEQEFIRCTAAIATEYKQEYKQEDTEYKQGHNACSFVHPWTPRRHALMQCSVHSMLKATPYVQFSAPSTGILAPAVTNAPLASSFFTDVLTASLAPLTPVSLPLTVVPGAAV